MSENLISDADLQAYVDGQLDAERVLWIEEYLEGNPGAAARVAEYIAQSHDLRAAFSSIAARPGLASVKNLESLPIRVLARRMPWQAAAAGVLLALVIGGAGGWLANGQMTLTQMRGIPALTAEAVTNHLVFTADSGHPVELAADQQNVLVHWLSKRLNTPVKVPDLTSAGYRFMGGRLAATDRGPAAMLMYEDAHGDRLTVFTRPMQKDRRDLDTVPVSADGVQGFAWICDGSGYIVLETNGGNDLRNVAEIVRRQVDPS